MAAILKTCRFKVTWFIRHTRVRHLAIRSYKRKTSHFALTKQDPWKTQTAGISPEEVLYVQKRVVMKKKYPGEKSEKTLYNFFFME